MTAVILLSDEELHEELLLHGITTPVTATTRSLLRKKLQLARKGKAPRKRAVRTYSSVEAYSSEEDAEEQEEEEVEDQISNTRSKLFSTPTSGRSATSPSRKKESYPTYRSTFIRHQPVEPRIDYDTGSDAEDVLPTRSSRHGYSRTSLNDSVSSSENLGLSGYSKNYGYSQVDAHDRSTLGAIPTGIENGGWNFHPQGVNKSKKGGFSLLKPSSWASYFRTPKVDKTSVVGDHNGSRIVSPYFPSPRKVSPSPVFPQFSQGESGGGMWCPGVSTVLLLMFALFFVMLGLTYVRLVPLPSQGLIGASLDEDSASAWERFEGQELEENGLKLPICPPRGAPQPSTPCLSQAEVVVAPEVLAVGRRLVAEAERRHAEYQCGGRPIGHLSVEDLRLFLGSISKIQDDDLLLGVSALAKLASLNPALGLEPVLDPPGGGDELAGVDWPGRALQGLRLRAPPLHLLCALMGLASLGLAAAGLTALGCGVFALVLWCVRRLQRRRQQHLDQVHSLVRGAVRVVRGDPRPCTPVPHVRDELIPPSRRPAMARVWDDAVSFLDRHESRMVREVRVVGGEECDVWRWTGGPPVPTGPVDAVESPDGSVTSQDESVRPQERTVTSQDGSVKSPDEGTGPRRRIYPELPPVDTSDDMGRWWRGVGPREAAVCAPTACLKIRNLAPPGRSAEWVRAAVLSKCGGTPVRHLAVERHGSERLVYLMASSVEAAGEIHTQLHGHWFEGELVSVKFVREERYFERFPSARHSCQPLTTPP